MIVGDYIENIECESFLDPETGRVRIRPLPNQGIPTNLVIECSRTFRDTAKYPLRTKFKTENVKVCQKDVGRIYLRAQDQMLYKI
ncbi:hypothetical protein [Winogradskyella poriferorum]|uniref:hypothetical protein n=1 Tax=Winogradskyella poriferorum TaxID=307627 RepID=UPI003D64C9D8